MGAIRSEAGSEIRSNPALADAEIIAVGSELLTPDRADTNSLYLTAQLNGIGVEVRRKSIIGDDRALLAAEVRSALKNAGLVILTGGLGPTEDDVTREAVADALGRPLVFRQDLLDTLMERFQRLNRKMADNNRRQTFVIEGAEPLPNARGTAAGQMMEWDGRVVMLLPGPPHELKAMFETECMPRLIRRLPPQAIGTRFYRVSCMGESDLDQLISPIYKPFENPVTTILAGLGDIQIHLRARARTAEEAEQLLEQVAPRMEERLGDRIYSRDGASLEAVVGGMLRERGATVSVAESCTGGSLGERITSVAGSSDYFLGGFLVYTDRVKTELLGVDAALIAEHSAVSEAAAAAMALGARSRTGSTYALSVTGEAGPTSATGTPVGTVVLGLAGPDGVKARRYNLFGDRNGIRARAVTWALDDLRRAMSGNPR
jgi:nicotinamide-nucleotide amidase